MYRAEQNVRTAPPAQDDRRTLVRRRTELEARLIAHRCGWRQLDEVRLQRLYRALASTLEALGDRDPAEMLIAGDRSVISRWRQPLRS